MSYDFSEWSGAKVRLPCKTLAAMAALTGAILMSVASAEGKPPAATVNDPAVEQARALVAQLPLAEKFKQLVNAAPAVPGLGIPAYNWWTEGLHGLATDQATTNFPEPIGMAATFDAGMVQDMAEAIAQEMRANRASKLQSGDTGRFGSGLDAWGPNINIFRDPRWGRGQETYGEDPYLTARLGVAYVKGMQGPDPAHPLAIATPKHFAVHSGPESTRHTADVKVSMHDLEDTYLPAFRATIVEGHAGSVMCAYNAINGTPACANEFLLKTKLREAWGFHGYVVSDCEALGDIANGHRFSPSPAAAVAAAFGAGVDNECTFGGVDAYVQAVSKGMMSEAQVDQSLVRLLAARIRLGDVPQRVEPIVSAVAPDIGGIPGAGVTTAAHARLALKAAAESVVLLKNDHLLPLPAKLRIAVVGPLAASVRVLRGNYSSTHAVDPVSILAGIRAAFPEATVEYVPSGPFAGDGDIVPSSVLEARDGSHGVDVTFYAAPPPAARAADDSDGALSMSGAGVPDIAHDAQILGSVVKPTVNFEAFSEPVTGLPGRFNMTWTGTLVAPATGLYRLGVKGVDCELSIDGQSLSVAKRAGFMPGLPKFKTMRLEALHRYDVRVVAAGGGFAAASLLWSRVSETPEEDAKAAAARADVVVAVVGITSDLEGEESPVTLPGFQGGDRTTLDLPAEQTQLLEAVRSTGKPLVIVTMNGSALNLEWAKQNASAILEAWYPGQAGGSVVGSILSGAVNPSGRLPITFYRDVSDLPPFDDYRMANRTYRYFKGTPLYPFGYGLSFTNFSYGPLKLTPAGDGYRVTGTVTNVGKLGGDEVVQLYLKFPSLPGAPRIALRGVQRVHLEPGDRRSVRFELSPRDLSSVTPQGRHRVAPGAYVISVGGGQPGTGVAGSQLRFAIHETIPVSG